MTQQAILAGGCFWGVEYLFQKLPGVVDTEVGYTGGEKDSPSYQEVCEHQTGHYEAIKITFDNTIISYQEILKFFFEIHNFEQTNGQGPDLGEQYLSVIFYLDDVQKQTANDVLNELKDMNYKPATLLLAAKRFWQAEAYHQDYYIKNNSTPYCHKHRKIFT